MDFYFGEVARTYRYLSDLKESLGNSISRPDRAAVMIGACIEHGFNTRHKIIKGLRVTGLSPNLVARILDELTGDVRGIHLWRCDTEGVYYLLDEA